MHSTHNNPPRSSYRARSSSRPYPERQYAPQAETWRRPKRHVPPFEQPRDRPTWSETAAGPDTRGAGGPFRGGRPTHVPPMSDSGYPKPKADDQSQQRADGRTRVPPIPPPKKERARPTPQPEPQTFVPAGFTRAPCFCLKALKLDTPEFLALTEDADMEKQVKKSFVKLSRGNHPDKVPEGVDANEIQSVLNAARQVFSEDTVRRAQMCKAGVCVGRPDSKDDCHGKVPWVT